MFAFSRSVILLYRQKRHTNLCIYIGFITYEIDRKLRAHLLFNSTFRQLILLNPLLSHTSSHIYNNGHRHEYKDEDIFQICCCCSFFRGCVIGVRYFNTYNFTHWNDYYRNLESEQK